ncbi:LamG-like jellyroll fold domain-containing protein [Actinotalea solisilvae]|uniref:LamG-like jellyroll fold domain-containing protein n=1 Tax=Actinotalea solisilvae TaxID=2072922 RepID=UPI0018F2354A|nr:LamG-like jellyroll fold domain-containing protein [Actinotalea solisilvae]
MRVPPTAPRRRVSWVLLSLLVVGAAVAPPAVADVGPAAVPPPPAVTADPLPTTQVDGVVWTQLVLGGTVYVGGSFASARPAGAAPGVGEVPRRNLLAYDLATGELVPGFAPVLDGQVLDLAASPDGRTLYVAGQFTSVDGQTRYRAAAFDVATGALVPTFRPVLNGKVSAIGATASTVVMGGTFTSLNGVPRSKVAAVSPTGATQPLSADVQGGSVLALAVAPDAASVVVGGSFTSVGGSSSPGYGLARLDLASGATLPLPVNSAVRNAGANAAVMSLETDGTAFYGTGYHYGTGGNLEGSFAASWATGDLVWVEDCHGDTYSAFPIGDVVYQASHKHDCSNTGGFPHTNPGTYHRATAVTRAATRVNTPDPDGAADHRGRPGPTFLEWYPEIDAGTYTGKNQGPWTVTGTAEYALFGGEFTRVGGVAQQGLVRFAVPALAPDAVGPQLTGGTTALVARSTAAGRVQLSWRAGTDADDATLTYRVLRGSPSAPPVHEQTLTTSFWDRHAMTFRDVGLPPGSTQQYRLVVSDPDGNVAESAWVSVQVSAAGARSAYAETVMDDAPAAYWRLGETAGTTLDDTTGTLPATAGAGVVAGGPGALAGDADGATRFSGATTASAASAVAGNAPEEFSVEAWVRTTSTTGGKIVGFGSLATGTSSQADRHLYMDDRGRLLFGIHTTGLTAVLGSRSYNDDAWHHVVGTYADGTMRLYVDGAQVAERSGLVYVRPYWGRWRLGGDRLLGWPADPTSDNLAATLDEVAVYTRALSAARVAAHHTAGRTVAANQAPTASFAATPSGLAVRADGGGSSDPDGRVATWSWAFGDGATATGPVVDHAYAAAGTYPVTLTVTDDRGATASMTRDVTVTAPPAGVLAQDAFERTVAGGWGTADLGGTWTATGTAAQHAVGTGQGRHVVAAGATLTSALAVASTSTDVSVVVSPDRVPTGGGAFVVVQARRVAAADAYAARVRLQADGSVQLHVTRGNGSPVAGVVVPGLTYAAGDRLQVRVQATGSSPTTVRAKVWRAGTPEPAAWHTQATDTTASLQVPGAVGLSTYLFGSATNGPLTVAYDDLAVRAVP